MRTEQFCGVPYIFLCCLSNPGVSNKTQSIALHYQAATARESEELRNDLRLNLHVLEEKKDELLRSIELLEDRQADVLRLYYRDSGKASGRPGTFLYLGGCPQCGTHNYGFYKLEKYH